MRKKNKYINNIRNTCRNYKETLKEIMRNIFYIQICMLANFKKRNININMSKNNQSMETNRVKRD